ncbi:MAG TPA: hypothetical protein VGR68_03415 [Actinomycetota bacterium]|nr:hypothetical protein [Actinomycetota bacterium]
MAFRPAVEEALEGLRDRTGLGCWLLLGTGGDGWTVLAARDRHYGIGPGDRLADGELPVRALLEGRGPRVAPPVAEVDAYAYAGTDRLRGLPVGAFAGIPVQGPTGACSAVSAASTRRPRGRAWPASCPPSSCSVGCSPACSTWRRTARSCGGASSGPSWTRSPTRSPASATAAPGTGCETPRRPAAAATARPPRWSPSTWTS